MKFCYECGVKVVRKMKKVGSRKRNAGDELGFGVSKMVIFDSMSSKSTFHVLHPKNANSFLGVRRICEISSIDEKLLEFVRWSSDWEYGMGVGFCSISSDTRRNRLVRRPPS